MGAIVQSFTRYFYQNRSISNPDRNTFCNPEKMLDHDFDELTLSNTVYSFGDDIKHENKLSVKITIEPFKNKNTNSKGCLLYLQKNVPYRKDVTGLKPLKFTNTYYGDIYEINDKGLKNKELVLVQVIPETKEMIIDVFYGYYPKDKREFYKVIDQHYWHKKTTPRGGYKSFKTFKDIKK